MVTSRRARAVASTAVVLVFAAAGVAWAAGGWNKSSVPKGVSGVGQISCATKQDCWASVDQSLAPYSQEVLHTTNGGKSWSKQTVDKVPDSPDPGGTSGISCPTASECLTLGDLILRTTNSGKSWKRVGYPTTPNLDYEEAIFCADKSTCWVAGDLSSEAGIFKSSNAGKSWQLQAEPWMGGVTELWCLNKNDCWALGDRTGSQMYQTFGEAASTANGGKTWKVNGFTDLKVSVGGAPDGITGFSGVSCMDSSHCVLVGNTSGAPLPRPGSARVLLTSDGGKSWKVKQPPARVDVLESVSCIHGTKHCWATGSNVTSDDAYILASGNGGAGWSIQKTVPKDQLTGLACWNTKLCTAGGLTGKIFYTTNGG